MRTLRRDGEGTTAATRTAGAARKAFAVLALTGAGLSVALVGASAAQADQWEVVGSYDTWQECHSAGQTWVSTQQATTYACYEVPVGDGTAGQATALWPTIIYLKVLRAEA